MEKWLLQQGSFETAAKGNDLSHAQKDETKTFLYGNFAKRVCHVSAIGSNKREDSRRIGNTTLLLDNHC